MTTQEKIAVMQAYVDGKKIQCKTEDVWFDWCYTRAEPVWDWRSCKYRIKPEQEEPIYRPYKDFAEFHSEWEKHGGWVKVHSGCISLWTRCDVDSFKLLLKEYVWTDDNTPCGIRLED